MSTIHREVEQGARDPARVRDQYEDYWREVRDQASRILAAEPDSLARALNLCVAAQAARPRKARWMRGRRLGAILAGRPLPPTFSGRGIDMIARVAIADLVAACCTPDTRRIIELGSGWGANLFQLWLGGAPRWAEFVALEYTETGREVAEMLARTAPDMAFAARPFDYHRPDLSDFRTAGRTVVFTCHSIEQITYLNDGLFDQLLAIPGLERVIHLEPVGWQLQEGAALGAPVRWLSRLLPPGLSLEADIRRRSRSHGYNKDLIPRLRRLEAAGRIRIERIARNYLGANPLNPGTAIVWRPA